MLIYFLSIKISHERHIFNKYRPVKKRVALICQKKKICSFNVYYCIYFLNENYNIKIWSEPAQRDA